MKRVSITHLGNSHNEWLRSLDFYKSELKVLKNRLTEIAGKNSGSDVLRQVEHYENQFAVQNENIDVLSQEIRRNLSEISAEAEASSAGYIDGALLAHHNSFSQKYQTEEKVINELRHSFNEFASAWM